LIEMDQAQKEAAEARGIVACCNPATSIENPAGGGHSHRCRSLGGALPSNGAANSLCGCQCPAGIAPACRLIARSDSEGSGTQAAPGRLPTGELSPYVGGRAQPWAATGLRPLAVRLHGSASPLQTAKWRNPSSVRMAPYFGDLNGREPGGTWSWGGAPAPWWLADFAPRPKVGNPYSYRGATYQQEGVRS